jgi:hypothetical protein
VEWVLHFSQCMMGFLRNLLPFLNRRRASRASRFGNRTSALAHRVGGKRGGIAMGSLLSLAAPFIIKRVMARRADKRAHMQPAL